MSMFSSTARDPAHMVGVGTRCRALILFAVFGTLVASGAPPAGADSLVAVAPSVQVEPFKQQFRLQDRITFILKNNSGRPLYFYCGLEAQVGGQWREAATDVRLPCGVAPVAHRGGLRPRCHCHGGSYVRFSGARNRRIRKTEFGP